MSRKLKFLMLATEPLHVVEKKDVNKGHLEQKKASRQKRKIPLEGIERLLEAHLDAFLEIAHLIGLLSF